MLVLPILQQGALTSSFKAVVHCSQNVDAIIEYLPTFLYSPLHTVCVSVVRYHEVYFTLP